MPREKWDGSRRQIGTPTMAPGARNGASAQPDGLSGAQPERLPERKAELSPAEHARQLKLDTVTDPRHWTYKVPGILVLIACLTFAAIGVYDPANVFWVVQVLGLYLLIRFFLVVLFYPVGEWRIRRLERKPPPTREDALAIPPGFTAPIHHVIILANFKEPEEVVARTLERLTQQANARDVLTVVMAMEEAEPGSKAKGERLKRHYGRYFANMLVTVHPRGLPGEVPGKGSNLAWAARRTREYLVEHKGIPLDSLTATSCDSDSLVHPGYFAELSRKFASDERRYERIWQAPFRFNNNIWRSPAPIRLLGFLNNMVQVSELANPFAVNMPLSTYSLSFKLAYEVGYWDEMVIAEDWHILLRCLYGTLGRTTLEPIFLPTCGDSVTGDNIWDAFGIFYKQRLRHAWGASDVGYMLQQWNRWPGMPTWPKVVTLAKVLHDHFVFTVAGLLLGVGSIVMVLQHGLLAVAAPFPGLYTFFLQSGNVVTAVGTASAWLFEHLTSRRASPGWRPDHLLSEALTWPLLAPFTLALVIIPTFEAQFRQMFGGDLVFWRTPKKAADTN